MNTCETKTLLLLELLRNNEWIPTLLCLSTAEV